MAQRHPGGYKSLERRAALATQRSRLRNSPAPAIRNRRGEEPIKISATEAKNKLGEVLDSVMQSGMVLITRHETPKAVLLSMEEYGALSHTTQTRLDTLNGEFDALLARMQSAKARAGMKAAFAASSKQLGKAAVEAPRKRARSNITDQT
jgi:antitoxin Phd